jgi:hypothetical protein
MKSYYISDCIQIDVDDSYKWTPSLFFNNGLASTKSGLCCKGLIRLKWGKKIDKTDTRSIGDGAYIGEQIYIDEKYGVRFEYVSDNIIQLTVRQECNEWLVIAIELLLLQQGKTLIHAAAVEKDGKALVMPSWGGVGKTAIVCKLIKEYSWKLLGDDLVIIDENQVYPFLKPFVIYPYHKKLFPELFQKSEYHIIKNLAVSKFISKVIPTIKRIFRPFPFMLAFLRRHNPQSLRVAPQKIFSVDSISKGGVPSKIVWLDRSAQTNVVHTFISAGTLASRAASVSSVELFSEKLNCIYHLCGCGILNYDDTIVKINKIILNFAQRAQVEMLQIPVVVPIEAIGDIAYDILI